MPGWLVVACCLGQGGCCYNRVSTFFLVRPWKKQNQFLLDSLGLCWQLCGDLFTVTTKRRYDHEIKMDVLIVNVKLHFKQKSFCIIHLPQWKIYVAQPLEEMSWWCWDGWKLGWWPTLAIFADQRACHFIFPWNYTSLSNICRPVFIVHKDWKIGPCKLCTSIF